MVPPPVAAVRLAVPAFVVLEVAAKELIFVAFAIAPELITKISLPVPKSVIPSVPESTLKVSSPALPVITFALLFPVIVSSPAPPFTVSSPAPP